MVWRISWLSKLTLKTISKIRGIDLHNPWQRWCSPPESVTLCLNLEPSRGDVSTETGFTETQVRVDSGLFGPQLSEVLTCPYEGLGSVRQRGVAAEVEEVVVLPEDSSCCCSSSETSMATSSSVALADSRV